MATMNPFDLLGDDAEDPTQLAVAQPLKVEKVEKAQPAKASKMPSKPLPPAQAVREAKSYQGGGRGGGGGRGFSRGRGGGFNRDARTNPDTVGHENGYSGGFRPSEEGERSERHFTVGGFRGRGGRRGFSNGDSADGERPRRMFERRSGTGRGSEFKRDGSGRGNWGAPEDEIAPRATEDPAAGDEKNVVAEKQGGEEETTDASKENPAEEQQEKEPEDKEMTLEEYEKVLEEKRKALQATKMEERKVDAKVFETMQQLSNKKSNDEVFIKLGSEKDKRRESGEKEEKAKKAVSINEFLKPADGESYGGRGYRGRGRGGRGGPRGGGYGGYGSRYGGAAAPSIEDTAQFPTLGK